MGEVHLTYRGMAEVMFEKACLDSRIEDRLEKIGYFTAPARLEKEVDKAVADFYDPQGDLFEGGKE